MNTEKLNAVLKAIKEANNNQAKPISEDGTNEVLIAILNEHADGVKDDADALTEMFGESGLQRIRDAEQGFY